MPEKLTLNFYAYSLAKMYLYIVESDHTNRYGTRKLGSTEFPVHRLRVYNTGDAPDTDTEKRYAAIWRTSATSRRELQRYERLLHSAFAEQRRKRKNGGASEWFNVTVKDITSFIAAQSWCIGQLKDAEVQDIRERSENPLSADEHEAYAAERLIVSQQEVKGESLQDRFFATFLPGGNPRRNQLEVWDAFEDICEKDRPYKGIIQWITGAGKTIAMLILIVLVSHYAKKKGHIFRGLLIAPKNDIFDTIIYHIRKLSLFGIQVCEGHNARLSSLDIPRDRPILVTATHASLTDEEMWNKLPQMSFVHYDEVHRITGEEFYNCLVGKLAEWSVQYLTGTSATPRTCSPSQHKKIIELFGNTVPILHRCDVDEAIAEGWIAPPRFGVNVIPNTLARDECIATFLEIIARSIEQKKGKHLWRGGKVIAYLPSISDVCKAVAQASSVEGWNVYTAVEEARTAHTDEEFVSAPADGNLRILFACERYREGSDIKGLEMTCILMGNTIGANILIQIAGRALRNDYAGKEGWCIIARPSEPGTTEDDILDSIVLQIMEFLGDGERATTSAKKIRKLVERFFSNVSVNGKVYDIEETVQRIQALYVRKTFERANSKEKYDVIRSINRELGIQSKIAYEEYTGHHPKYIQNPKVYFRDSWISWYHFLGIDTTRFPQTKSDWTRIWKERGITSWEDYKKRGYEDLPTEPGEMYESYTNPIDEFQVEEEIIW